MQTMRVAYRATSPDGEVDALCHIDVHDRYVNTIIDTFREMHEVKTVLVRGPVWSPALCVQVFFEAVRAIVYLNGERLESIKEVTLFLPAETA